MSDKYGLVGWDENVNTQAPGNKGGNKDEYMRLQPGSNRLRLVTDPFQYWSHKWKPEGLQGFGEKVYCSKFKGSCPCCDTDSKPKRRWFAGVIDRKTGTYKILDMGVAIYQGIQGFSRDEDWGSPLDYDVDVVVDKQGGATGYYKVIPKPKKPFSDEDVVIKENVDLPGLKRKCDPPTPEQVQKRMDGILGKIRGKAAPQEEPEAPAETETTAAATSDDGEDMVFPPADAQSAAQ